MIKRIWVWMGLVVFLSVAWIVWQKPDEKMHLVFCDVGQGDATLVVKGDFQVLIDGGPGGEKTLDCLAKNMPFWDKTIEVVINTHPEKDHLGGLDEVLGSYGVGQLVINGIYKEGKDAEKLRQEVIDKGVRVVVPEKGDVIRGASLQFEVLWPEEKQGEILAWTSVGEGAVLGEKTGVNEMSVVIKIDYGEFGALLTGDISEVEEKKMLDEGILSDVDVLKVAHHGSKYSSSAEFLEEVKPEEAVIMVGKNSYGHPTDEVLGRLKDVGSRVWRTDSQGQVEVVSDGKGYFVLDEK
jgi:competence protein ComEC